MRGNASRRSSRSISRPKWCSRSRWGGATGGGVLLTCEHASAAVPEEYRQLGLTADQLHDHIGWDIGAAALTTTLSRLTGTPAVLSGVSRLLVDCNRDLADADLIPSVSHGVVVPGNAG